MIKNKFKQYLFTTVLILLVIPAAIAQSDSFITVKGHQFFNGNEKALYYIGTNYWYGGLLGLEKENNKGIDRLRNELDFLQEKGITNLRVMAGPEGEGLIIGVNRVKPPLQPSESLFDPSFLTGLDVLLTEMGKRNMKAVIFLSNNWEWSGGFLQYLQWNGMIADSVFKRKLSWDETRDYVSRFYSCKACKAAYLKQADYIINRTNSITKMKYADDPAIMSWEIANEPRPMRPAAIADYKSWISAVASFIKSIDKNHLVTIGTEGYIGTENIELYEDIHTDKNIDYLTIHIWPKNWEWFTGTNIAVGMDSVLFKTTDYILKHLAVAKKINKPLVIEEFGLPRDGHSFNLNSTTISRDNYYRHIFTTLEKNKKSAGVIAGVNFWSYGGLVKPAHTKWQDGDEYIGDPPMEEQGLNAVFNTDKTTWELIRSFSTIMKK